jgi:WD40 repeat protein
MYYKPVIERYPLQTYVSALLFSPKQSMVRNLYAYEESKEITIVSPVAEQWNACLQTLEGHSSSVSSVVFSHDSTRLASASRDSTIKIWDARNGDCLQTLEGHSGSVISVVFSHDSTRLASASGDSTIKIWDATNGDCLQTLENHHVDDLSVLFLQHPNGEGMPDDSQQPHRSLDGSIAISQDRFWVTRNSQKVLWLPSEYRPASYKVSKETVGIGTGSGRVWICRFRAAG